MNWSQDLGWEDVGHHASKGSGGWYQGGGQCGHLGKIVVWAFEGRAFSGAGTHIVVDPDVAAVIDLAGSAEKQLKKWDPPTPPAPPNFVDQAKGFIGSSFDTPMRDRIMGVLAEAQTRVVLPPVPPAEITTPKPLYLPLNWSDMTAPKVGVTFWQALWSSLPQGTVDQPKRIQVCCVGGHGRTGTCLASLMIVGGGYNWKNALNHVRLYHCMNAVENDAQVTYLRNLSKILGTDTLPVDVGLADALDAAYLGKKGAAPKPVVQPAVQAAQVVGAAPKATAIAVQGPTATSTKTWVVSAPNLPNGQGVFLPTEGRTPVELAQLIELHKPSRILVQPQPPHGPVLVVTIEDYTAGAFKGVTVHGIGL